MTPDITYPLSTSHHPSKVGPGDILRAQIKTIHAFQKLDSSDPLQRVGGSLAIHCSINLRAKNLVDIACVATAYRGYESLLPGMSLTEAGLISSTASGICGGVHAATSAQCLEMALGIKPPPLAIIARNLLLSCQYLNDSTMHIFLQCGPDYAQETVQATTPEIWAAAQRGAAARRRIHGYATIGAIMSDLNRGHGKLYLEALDMMRAARTAYRTLGGKFPHSEAICPGGVSFSLNPAQLDVCLGLLQPFVDYAKRCAAIWDDICDFLYAAAPDFQDLGRAPANMVDFGLWDHDDHYDGSFETCDRWGAQRWSTPGAVIDGALITTELSQLNSALEEFSANSFREPFSSNNVLNRSSAPLRPQHLRNKTAQGDLATEPGLASYSCASALTWKGHVFEVGSYARLYISARGKKLPHDGSVESTGHSLVFHMPAQSLPEERLEWRVPQIWNTLERNRARAYTVAFNIMTTFENARRAKSRLARGDQRTKAEFQIPVSGLRRGVGFGGAGRGLLAHWVVLSGPTISDYHIAVPSRINAGPRTPWGDLGPCERALRNTPIIESNWSGPASFRGIDLVRVVQSFDPCMPSKLHMIFEGTDFASTAEVNTDSVI